MPNAISIKVSPSTHQLLISRMMVRETFDHLVRRLLEATERRRRTRRPKEGTDAA